MLARIALMFMAFGVAAGLLVHPAAADSRVPGSRAEISLSFAPVVKAAAPSVVNIYARKIVERRASPFAGDPFFERFFRGVMPKTRQMENSLGSGVIVAADGLVVSNFHVVGGADEIRVVLADKTEFDAEVVLADERSDLAVLRLTGASDLPAIVLRDSDTVEVGDLVLAIGNPFGVGQTVTSGIVSALARTGGPNGQGYFIQTDAAINPGNSGGALVDMSGALVGVNTAILTRGGGSNGIGFAVPSNLVAQVVAQARGGRAELARPWSGIEAQPVTGDLVEGLGLPRAGGVVLRDLHPLSPFAVAGLQRGDVLVAVDKDPINSAQELEFRLASRGIGGVAPVTVMRAGQMITAEIALIAAPEIPPTDRRQFTDPGPFQDLIIGNLNPALNAKIKVPVSTEGVVVLETGVRARRAGWRAGDVIVSVNGRSISSTAGLEEEVRRRSDAWDVSILRDGRSGGLRFKR
ncbi:MAG: Do/DeqQ family serine protease [Paracoccaceae bacterium]|jgi:Do/DeqQ family serine protease